MYPVEGAPATLVGAHIASLRHRARLSRDVCVGSIRTEEWLAAVESGELALTAQMVGDVEDMFEASGRVVRLEPIIIWLQNYPLSRLARKLTTAISAGALENKTVVASTQTTAEPATAREAVSTSDRFLIFGPSLLLGAIVLLVGKSVLWAAGNPAPGRSLWLQGLLDFIDGIAAYAVVVGVVASAMVLPGGEAVLRRVSSRLRRPEATKAARETIRLIGVNNPKPRYERFDWTLAEYEGQLVPQVRSVALEIAMRTAFLERATPVVMLGALIAQGGAMYALFTDQWTWADLVPVIVAVAIGSMALRASRLAEISARQAYCALARAFGKYDYRIPARAELMQGLPDLARAHG